MSNNTVKKQNRLMLVALVFILAAATALVAITGTANRKKQNDPPLDDKTEITSDDKNSEKTNDKTDGKTDDKTDDKSKQGAVLKPAEGDKTPVRQDDKNNANKKDSEAKPENKQNENDKTEKTNAVDGTAAQASANAVEDVLPVFSTPVDGIVIKGASLTLPVFSYTMNDYRTHGGLDFACSPGTPVYAAADGEIANVTDDPMMGVTVSVSHAGGAQTVYKGLSEDTLEMVSVGKKVAGGDVIGVSGDTALIESAEENHMHFELSVNGEPKDPSEYMNVVFLSDLTED